MEGLASRTRLRILELIAKRDMDVSTLARALGLREPTVSGEVALLERLELLEVTYSKGRHGIRKVCRLAKKRVLVDFG
jgi:predicted transcriptional regulator